MSESKKKSFALLRGTVTSTKALIGHFETQIHNATLPLVQVDASSPNAIKLAADAFSILKAQTTKLSLLILNSPFSPSEVTFILKSLNNQCIPAMASACQLCPGQRYTNFFFNVIRSSVRTTFKSYLAFLDEIPLDEAAVEQISHQKTLNSTGMLWEGLDFMIKLGQPGLGLSTSAANQIEQIHALLKDAVQELEYWKTSEFDSNGAHQILMRLQEEEKALRETNDKFVKEKATDQSDALSSIDDNPFGLEELADPSILPAAKKVITAIKLLSLLQPPILKRRIRRFPVVDSATKYDAFPTEKQCADFDCAIEEVLGFGDIADAAAEAIYLNDIEAVEEHLDDMRTSVQTCISHVRKTWSGGEDEFTRWIDTWTLKFDEMKALPARKT